jgi:hypothetical protein
MFPHRTRTYEFVYTSLGLMQFDDRNCLRFLNLVLPIHQFLLSRGYTLYLNYADIVLAAELRGANPPRTVPKSLLALCRESGRCGIV